jgi:hypothetical protein
MFVILISLFAFLCSNLLQHGSLRQHMHLLAKPENKAFSLQAGFIVAGKFWQAGKLEDCGGQRHCCCLPLPQHHDHRLRNFPNGTIALLTFSEVVYMSRCEEVSNSQRKFHRENSELRTFTFSQAKRPLCPVGTCTEVE